LAKEYNYSNDIKDGKVILRTITTEATIVVIRIITLGMVIAAIVTAAIATRVIRPMGV
jgi:hypothetical protein